MHIFLLRLLLAGAVVAAASACSDSCQNDVVRTIDAPGGAYRAVLFQRDCGATTDFSTQISVIERGKSLSGGGNTFRADTDHGAAAAASWGGPKADFRWLAPDHLQIAYDPAARLFERETRVGKIRISYAERRD